MPIQHDKTQSKNCVLVIGRLYKFNSYDWYKDGSARGVFKDASDGVVELQQIVWVNPTCDNEEPIKWLQNGARAEAHRMLGA